MKKAFKTVLISVLFLIVFMLIATLLFFTIMLFTNESNVEYAKSSGWNCDIQNFDIHYAEFYKNKIVELKEKYNLECEEKWDQSYHDGDSIITAHLYNNYYTIYILFANRGLYGDYTIKLFYYGDDGESLKNYEMQHPLISFINDLTTSVAFESKTDDCKNRFEQLYDECYEKSKSSASYIYHFDDLVGYVGYTVGLSKDNYGYYYKMQKNSEINILANAFIFEGILTPID